MRGIDLLANQAQHVLGSENPNQCCPCPTSELWSAIRGPVPMWRVLSGHMPGGVVLSKVARPKSAAPVSLAGFQPPAAGLTPAWL
jgi:hypothetical protein